MIKSDALDTMPEPRVPPTCPALTKPHPSPTPALPSTSHHHTLSTDTHARQTTVHASQSQQPPHPHRVPRQPHRQTKDDHMTTTQGHRPSSKSERNLIIPQVNINGIKNKLEELKLLIHDTHVDIITIQETKLTPKANTPKVHNFTIVVPIGCTRQEVGSLETTLFHYNRHTFDYQHTTQNFKWSRYTLTTLNISQLQTFIYLLETAHPCTTKQLTHTYNTAYSTSQTYHTQSSLEM